MAIPSEGMGFLGQSMTLAQSGFETGGPSTGSSAVAGSKAQAFQDAMRRATAHGPAPLDSATNQLSPQPAGTVAEPSPVLDALVSSINKRDQKLKTIFSGDPSRPETVVDALNFMHRHQTALLEFHAVLQVAENLKNGINKLTNMQ